MYCKKKGRDQSANFPGDTAGDLFSVYKSGAPHGPSYLEIADRLGVLEPLSGCCSAPFLFYQSILSGGQAVKKVGLIMGSTSDLPTVQKAADVLEEFGVPYEMHIYSAHRTPV